MNPKPLIGIGACLIGQPVRYNGESKRRNPHIESLREHADLRPFCPEMGIGLGVPRQTVRLVGEPGRERLVDSDTGSHDHTEAMKAYARTVLQQEPRLAGYILVKGSPSCGYERVKRYNDKGHIAANDASGLFAAELMHLHPLLPVEEDGRLHDHSLRENFITRVYAWHDWQQFSAGAVDHHGLTRFWARYKYLVMAHHVEGYRRIGRLLANGKARPTAAIAEEFITLLMAALAKPATRKTHTNVLQHMRGYLKRELGEADKQELDEVIEHYRSGIVPLVVPLTLLRHHFRRHRSDYIQQQVFLRPYPEQLSLRNHV